MGCSKCGYKNINKEPLCSNCRKSLYKNTWIIDNTRNTYNKSNAERIPDYLIHSLIVTFFCCLPLGVVAIIYSRQVDERLKIGDYSGALYASRKAKSYCLISLIIGVFVMILYIFAALITM